MSFCYLKRKVSTESFPADVPLWSSFYLRARRPSRRLIMRSVPIDQSALAAMVLRTALFLEISYLSTRFRTTKEYLNNVLLYGKDARFAVVAQATL